MSIDSDRKKAVRELLSAVREIIGRWDVSGVLSSTEGRTGERLDEEHIATLAGMIIKNASVPEVAAFLNRVVAKSVGLNSDAGRNKEFAEQLVAAGKAHRLK